MSEAAVVTGLGSVLAAAHALVDELQAEPLDLATDDELLEHWRELERLARRLPTVEHRLIGEAEIRGLPGEHGCRSTAAFLRGLLRLDPREAHGPAYPQVAQAHAEGAISPRHARIIARTIEDLPDQVRHEHAEQVETDLVRHATVFDPKQLGTLALRVAACLDPDGRLQDVDYRARHRDLTLHRNPDGSGTLTGECTAELAERLDVLFDSLACPKPEADGVKDPRTAGQRRHDALLDALNLLQRSELLPTAGGVSATIVLTIDGHDYVNGTGLARTGHGHLIPTREALRWAGANHRLLGVLLDSMKGVTGYSSLQRCFTEPQRLALTARDRGCTFPGCDAPPAWCQVHHLADWPTAAPPASTTAPCSAAFITANTPDSAGPPE